MTHRFPGNLVEREASMKPVVGPGLPPSVSDPSTFIIDDCIHTILFEDGPADRQTSG